MFVNEADARLFSVWFLARALGGCVVGVQLDRNTLRQLLGYTQKERRQPSKDSSIYINIIPL